MHDLWRQLPHKVFIYLYVYDGNAVLKDLKFQVEDKGNFPFPICFRKLPEKSLQQYWDQKAARYGTGK